jgi:hypothetical protein
VSRSDPSPTPQTTPRASSPKTTGRPVRTGLVRARGDRTSEDDHLQVDRCHNDNGMDLSGHHSNPPGPLEALLNDASSDAEARREATEDGRTCASGAPGEAVCTAHPRHGRIIDAISQVLIDEGDPMQAREVHARVETLLGEPVRWSSVKATLAGNLKSPDPRFARVARGRYGVPPPPSLHSIDARPPTRPSRR